MLKVFITCAKYGIWILLEASLRSMLLSKGSLSKTNCGTKRMSLITNLGFKPWVCVVKNFLFSVKVRFIPA